MLTRAKKPAKRGPDASREERIAYEEKAEDSRARNDSHVLSARAKAAETTAPDASFDVTNLLQQMGRPLTTQQVMERLGKINRNFYFEVSNACASRMGIYLITPMKDETTGGIRTGKRFLCGMENGYMPEFSVRHSEMEEFPRMFPDVGTELVPVMKSETRGWRTILARLIKLRVITLTQAEKWFDLPLGRGSKNWKEKFA